MNAFDYMNTHKYSRLMQVINVKEALRTSELAFNTQKKNVFHNRIKETWKNSHF